MKSALAPTFEDSKMSSTINREDCDKIHRILDTRLEKIEIEIQKHTKILTGNGEIGLCEQVRLINSKLDDLIKRLEKKDSKLWSIFEKVIPAMIVILLFTITAWVKQVAGT